jgi:hypothetical protein
LTHFSLNLAKNSVRLLGKVIFNCIFGIIVIKSVWHGVVLETQLHQDMWLPKMKITE